MHLLSEIHFWSTREDVIVKHTDYGTFKYFFKKDISGNSVYSSKKLYCEQRGLLWIPTDKRPFKLKTRLKELEEYLLQNKVVCSSWEVNELHLLLSKGVLIHIATDPHTSDITSISFNKSLVNKIQAEVIYDGAIAGQQVACICSDGRVICQGGIWRDGWIIDGSSKRRISLHGEFMCVWGRVNAEHPQPWSPLAKDHQRANLLLYWVGAKGPELHAYKKTEGEPIDVIISRVQNKTLITIEQKVSLRGTVSVEVNTLEVTAKILKRTSVTAVPLQTQVSCCTLSNDENRLILGCIDGSVALLNRSRGSTQITKTSIIPTFAVWHRCGAIAVISNEKGQLQYFDTALNRINIQIFGEDCTSIGLLDLSGYFNIQPNVSCIKWGPKDLIVMLEHGPLVVVTHLERALTFTSVTQQYLKMGKIKKAIGVLLSWEWSDQFFSILQRIISHLLKLPLTEENAQNLQNTLSSFHSPPVPLSMDIKHKYGSQVRALTRRFFHQLVRYKMFETAFLLAVDIGHHDMFMDLYYCATEIGEREMAAAARAQASALLSRCSSEASCCSRSSCSQCSDSYSSKSDASNSSPENKEKFYTSSEYLSPPSHSFSDNYLTTNFNDINPKTYNLSKNCNNYVPSVSSIDLRKTVTPAKPAFNRISYLSQSSLFVPVTSVAHTAPPLPIAPSLANRNFPPQPRALPSVDSLTKPFNRSVSTPALTHVGHSYPTPPTNNQFWNRCLPSSPNFMPSQVTEHIAQNLHTSHLISPSLPLALPLMQNSARCTSLTPPPTTNASSSKKQQAKVKFSDTVTAFIVPEVKRPVRPPPPPHITDPQKELADSLPLCHPNEDYLKDFTPIRRNEPDEAPTQSKIKVVHFGVV